MNGFAHKQYREQGIEVVELSSDKTTLKIAVSLGNTLFSFTRNETELLYFPFSLEEYKTSGKLAGNPFMHPWANRLEGDHITIELHKHFFPSDLNKLIYRDENGLPIHGLLLKTDKWRTETVEQTESFIYHQAALEFNDPDWLRLFPFEHFLDMKTYLHEDEICIEMGIYNSGDKPMPLSFGFHPYFLIDPLKSVGLQLTIPMKDVLRVTHQLIPNWSLIPKERLWEFSGNKISLAENYFDHCFTDFTEQKFFHVEQAPREFDLHPDDGYQFVQIYAPNEKDKPYICIEPMQATANALNTNSCKMLEPGEFTTQEFTISFYDEQLKEKP